MSNYLLPVLFLWGSDVHEYYVHVVLPFFCFIKGILGGGLGRNMQVGASNVFFLRRQFSSPFESLRGLHTKTLVLPLLVSSVTRLTITTISRQFTHIIVQTFRK